MKPTTKPTTLSTLTLFRPLLLLTLFLIYPVNSAWGQAVPQAADCQLSFTFTAVNNTTAFDNRYQGCVTWTVQYTNTGFSVLSLVFQSAQGAAVVGTFGTYGGTTVTGANPMTSTTGEVSTFANGTVNAPWVRMRLASITGSGTVSGVLYGFKAGPTGGGVAPGTPCPGTVGTPCVVDGPTAVGNPPTTPPVLVAGQDGVNLQTLKVDTAGDQIIVGPDAAAAAASKNPVQVAGNDGSVVRAIKTDTAGDTLIAGGAAVAAAAKNPITTGFQDDSGNVLAAYAFPDQGSFTVSSGTDVIVVTGAASKKTYLGHISFTLDAAQTVTIRQGTGSTCGTSTLVIAGPYPNVVALALDFSAAGGLHTTVNANDLCVHLGGSATWGGGVVYGQH